MTNEFDDAYEEDLDEALMHEFSHKLESAINDVITSNLDKDPRVELLTTLISFAAQISQDLGITEDKFVEISEEFYKEAEASLCEEQINNLAYDNKTILN
jgi:predicted glycosyl hydrolase (DUF1957 family)